jgi:pimeloyl-ACP methyl ester carboxylesterase
MIFLGLALVFVFLVAPYLLARIITSAGTRPMDRQLQTTPADFQLDYQEVSLTARDGPTLKGWYLGGGVRGVSVACAHGLFRSRREVLDRAVFLRRAGYNVLLFDSRRHGESGGERVTLGFKERLDVEAALSLMRERAPNDRLALFGVSMGAAACLLAAAERPEVSAVIADSSFLSIEHAVVHHLNLFFGLPRFPLGDELLFFIGQRGGFRGEDFDIEKAVARIGDRPLLFIAGTADQRMPVEIQERLYRAARSPKSRLLVVEGATHGAAYRTSPELYEESVCSFLKEATRL